MSDASMPHCPHCNEPEYACECPHSDKMTDEDIDAEILDKEMAKDAPTRKTRELFLIKNHEAHDWCHICGKRSEETADVFYAKNAEHDKYWSREQYIRICRWCAARIHKAATNNAEDTP